MSETTPSKTPTPATPNDPPQISEQNAASAPNAAPASAELTDSWQPSEPFQPSVLMDPGLTVSSLPPSSATASPAASQPYQPNPPSQTGPTSQPYELPLPPSQPASQPYTANSPAPHATPAAAGFSASSTPNSPSSPPYSASGSAYSSGTSQYTPSAFPYAPGAAPQPYAPSEPYAPSTPYAPNSPQPGYATGTQPPAPFTGAQPVSPARTSSAGAGIAACILGALALVFSWVPFINIVAIIAALVGIGVGIGGIKQAERGGKSGKSTAITGIVLSAMALLSGVLFAFAYTHLFSESLESVNLSIVAPDGVFDDDFDADSDDSGASAHAKQMHIGEVITFDDGMEVSLDSAKNTTDEYGDKYIELTVTLHNAGTQKLEYNYIDWQGISAAGKVTDFPLVSLSDDQLTIGLLNPGEAITGTIALDTSAVQARFNATLYDQDTPLVWDLP